MKRLFNELTADLPPNENVVTEDRIVAGPEGAPDISIRIFRPVQSDGALPGIYVIHGGGMVMGDIDGEGPICEMLCETINAIVVSVEYRLAPEHPYPAAVEDCYAGLLWTAENADDLGIDRNRIAIYGGSAGGGLALATALTARDRGSSPVSFVMALYPMIDDRNETPSSHEIVDVGIWDRAVNRESWDYYLGGKPADGYAAPARIDSVDGMPPTFIDVGEVDLFRDEAITFASRLLQAGVQTELHVHPGSYHASEIFAPQAALSARIWARRIEALQQALNSSGA
jgi:acetyl esterase/lipase